VRVWGEIKSGNGSDDRAVSGDGESNGRGRAGGSTNHNGGRQRLQKTGDRGVGGGAVWVGGVLGCLGMRCGLEGFGGWRVGVLVWGPGSVELWGLEAGRVNAGVGVDGAKENPATITQALHDLQNRINRILFACASSEPLRSGKVPRVIKEQDATVHHSRGCREQLIDELAATAAMQPKTLPPNVDAKLQVDLGLDAADGVTVLQHEQQTHAQEWLPAGGGGHLDDRAAVEAESRTSRDAVSGSQAKPSNLPAIHDQHLLVTIDAGADLELRLDIADVVTGLDHQRDCVASRGRDEDLEPLRRGHGLAHDRRGPAHDDFRCHAAQTE
jgi:hypothetical protein